MAAKEIIYFLSFFPPDNCRHYNKYFSTQLEKQPILAHEKNTMNKWTLALGALTSKTEICYVRYILFRIETSFTIRQANKEYLSIK